MIGSLCGRVLSAGTYGSVLVATDGSSGTTVTLAHATSIARDNDATLHGLYVVDRRLYVAADKANQDEVRQSLEEEGDVALDAIEVGGEEAGVDDVTTMADGFPTRQSPTTPTSPT